MNTRFSSFIATVLTVVLIAPSVFFVAPQKAHAQLLTYDAVNWIENALSAVQETTSAVANVAEKVNTYVLQPLAFVLSGELLKAITTGIINFAIGEANGTGAPQFVADIQETLRTVSTRQAQGFFNGIGRNSNSPFASSIRSSLEDEFYSKSSLKGFWERNMSTMRQSSHLYSDNYLRGDWSRGGMRSWFALTTRIENNPYTLHQQMQRQLQDQIGHEKVGAVEARIQEVAWGNGFMSWCGEFGKSYNPASSTSSTAPGVVSSSPGDDCVDEDGNKAKIKTPGNVIAESLNKALGNDQDRIVRMGDVGPQVNQILNNMQQVAQTVNFAKSLLGGAGAGGLAGAGTKTSSQTNSSVGQYNTAGSLGATQAGVYQANIGEIGASVLTRATQYETAWKTVETSAKSAVAVLGTLKTSCTNYASEVDSVLAGPVASALAQVSIASTTVATTRATIAKLKADVAAATTSTKENFLPRIQLADTLPPTSGDISDAVNKSTVFDDAVATPAGSLNVSADSLVDQMNLISANASALKASCAVLPQ